MKPFPNVFNLILVQKSTTWDHDFRVDCGACVWNVGFYGGDNIRLLQTACVRPVGRKIVMQYVRAYIATIYWMSTKLLYWLSWERGNSILEEGRESHAHESGVSLKFKILERVQWVIFYVPLMIHLPKVKMEVMMCIEMNGWFSKKIHSRICNFSYGYWIWPSLAGFKLKAFH